MAFEIGNKLSEELVAAISESLTRKDLTQIAVNNDMSFETARNLVNRSQVITKKNLSLVEAIVKETYSVNKLEITRRRSNNEYLESFLAETAA